MIIGRIVGWLVLILAILAEGTDLWSLWDTGHYPLALGEFWKLIDPTSLQLAEAGDKIEDPSTAWPDTRKKVELGTISITKAVADSQAAEKKLLFVPGALVPGIEAADPMIAARSAAYIVSLSRRAQTQ